MPYRKFTSIVILMQSNIRHWGNDVNGFHSHRITDGLLEKIGSLFDCSISSSTAGHPRVFPTKHYKISFKWNCLKLYLFSRLYTFIYLNERFLRARRLHIIVSIESTTDLFNTFVSWGLLRSSSTFVTTDSSLCTTRKSDVSWSKDRLRKDSFLNFRN